jgi:hypothetical protein
MNEPERFQIDIVNFSKTDVIENEALIDIYLSIE